MKILLTEKQADRIFNNKVECEKCEHSWKKEDGDSHPYLPFSKSVHTFHIQSCH